MRSGEISTIRVRRPSRQIPPKRWDICPRGIHLEPIRKGGQAPHGEHFPFSPPRDGMFCVAEPDLTNYNGCCLEITFRRCAQDDSTRRGPR